MLGLISMLGLKLHLVDFRGNARYHVAIVPNEWLSAYLDTLISEVFLVSIIQIGGHRQVENKRKREDYKHREIYLNRKTNQ